MTNENRNHCKYIAEQIEAYYNGDVYKCPECGEVFTTCEAIDLDNDEIRCPNCENTSIDSEFEILGLWDYFDDYLNLEYRIESDRRTVRSVQIMVTCGGPNIYIDTASKAVELYWWSDRADYPLSYEVCNAIDEMFQELWDMGC